MTETTREQDHAIEALSLEHDGCSIAVKGGLEDAAVHASTQRGHSYVVDRFGGVSREGTGLNFSVKGWLV